MAVASLLVEIGPIFCAGVAVQPSGTVSATDPAGSVPAPDFAWTVTWNGSPATLKNRENVRYSRVFCGKPPGSGIDAPKKIDLSIPAAGFAAPLASTFGWNGTNDSVIPNREQAGSATPWNIVRLCVG